MITLLQWSPSQPLDVRSHDWSALYHYQESRHLLACSKKSVFFKLPQSQICHNHGQINQPSSAHTKDHSAYYTPVSPESPRKFANRQFGALHPLMQMPLRAPSPLTLRMRDFNHSAFLFTQLEAAKRRDPEARMELLASGGGKTLTAALRWTSQERRAKGQSQ